jgi:hypothetical protein
MGKRFRAARAKFTWAWWPHLLAAIAGDKQQEYRFVVLDEGPDKFKLEIK